MFDWNLSMTNLEKRNSFLLIFFNDEKYNSGSYHLWKCSVIEKRKHLRESEYSLQFDQHILLKTPYTRTVTYSDYNWYNSIWLLMVIYLRFTLYSVQYSIEAVDLYHICTHEKVACGQRVAFEHCKTNLLQSKMYIGP